MNNSNEIKIGAVLSYVNLAIGCIIPLFYTPIMLDLMGQAEYGLYSLSNSVTGYLSLMNFGVGAAITRYITQYRSQNQIDGARRMVGLFVTIYSCLAVLVLIGGAVLIRLCGSFFGEGLSGEEIEKMRGLLVVMTINTAITFPLGLFSVIITSYEKYLFHKCVCIVETLLAPSVNLIILYLGYGSFGIAVGGLVVSALGNTTFLVYSAKRLKVYPVFSNMPFGILKELLVFCAFVFMSSIVDMLYWATDKVLIGAVLGAAAVAVYNIGGTFNSMLQGMAHAISNVFSSRVHMMVANHSSKDEISALMIHVGRIQYLVVSLILSGYCVFGQQFLHFWAGPEYSDAYYIALLTMIPLGIPLIQNVAFTTILAENKHRFRSIMYAVVAVANVISTYIVLPHYGIIGAAVCTAVSYLLGQGIVMNLYYYHVTKLDIPAFWKNIGQMSIVPVGMIIICRWLLRHVVSITSMWGIVAGAAVYSICFAVLSWIFSLNRDEKDMLGGMLNKILRNGRKK